MNRGNRRGESHRSFDEQKILRLMEKRRWLAVVLMAILLTGTFWVFVVLWQGRHYMIMSALILVVILLSFLFVLQLRPPRARELVLLATMSAFCVLVNELCAHTVPLHAGTAMVILTGIACGPEAGFVVGAVSRLVCNFFNGQGAWTPWEMISWGILGFMAGVFFVKPEVSYRWKSEKIPLSQNLYPIFAPLISLLLAELLAYLLFLCSHTSQETFFGWRIYVFGFVGLLFGALLQKNPLPVNRVTMAGFTIITVFILYGGIMNFATLFLKNMVDSSQNAINRKVLKGLFIAGAPYDLAHALTAAFCMVIFGKPMLQKLRRIQIKYGMYEKGTL